MTKDDLGEALHHAIEKARVVAFVEVRDQEIIVTLPRTSYATYFKPTMSPQLLARIFPLTQRLN